MKIEGAVRSRLTFDGLEYVTLPDGSRRVSVRLEWAGDSYEATVGCLGTQQGVIKAASRAALQPAVQASLSSASHLAAAGVNLDVVGVKAVRAFDGWVVVTRVHGSVGSEVYQLLGAAPCEDEDDLPGAAVKAVLNASNRVLGQWVAR